MRVFINPIDRMILIALLVLFSSARAQDTKDSSVKNKNMRIGMKKRGCKVAKPEEGIIPYEYHCSSGDYLVTPTKNLAYCCPNPQKKADPSNQGSP